MELELWNKYNDGADNALTFQLMEIVVDKCNEGVFGILLLCINSLVGWGFLLAEDEKFSLFFMNVVDMLLSKQLTIDQMPTYISFFKYAFQVFSSTFSSHIVDGG